MAPAQAAALLIVPSVLTNLQQMRPLTSLALIGRRLWPMLAGIVAGTLAGGGLIGGAGQKAAAAGLGAALVAYAAIGFAQVRFQVPARSEPWLGPLVGAVTGAVTAATGVFVMPAVPYLQAIGFDKDELVQALGLSFFVSTLALGFTLAGAGIWASSLAVSSVLTLVPALAGQVLGQMARGRIDPPTFRRWFFLGLLALGAVLVLRWAAGEPWGE
jgi:uncharacterized protein